MGQESSKAKNWIDSKGFYPEKLSAKWFLVVMGLLLTCGVGLAILVVKGYGPNRSFLGVAINNETKECATYRYTKFFGTSEGRLPTPKGWQVYYWSYTENGYGLARAPEEHGVNTPYGEVYLDRIQEGCEKYGLRYVSLPSE